MAINSGGGLKKIIGPLEIRIRKGRVRFRGDLDVSFVGYAKRSEVVRYYYR